LIGGRLADVLAIRDIPEVPEALFRASVTLGAEIAGEHIVAAHVHFAHHLVRLQRIDEARNLLARARAQNTSIVRSEIELRSLAGHIAFATGDLDTAVHELEGALDAARETQYVAISIEALIAVSRVQTACNDLSRAAAMCEEAINMAHHSSFRIFEATAQLHLAETCLAMGDSAAASDAATVAARLAWCDGGTHTAAVLLERARALLTRLQQPMPLLPEPPSNRPPLPVVRELSKHRYGLEIA
jgi:ATP/maltotriose-dependent transcriptional regulator MalT